MVEDLEDLFSTQAKADDKTLSTEGVEELFGVEAEAPLEDSLSLVEKNGDQPASAAVPEGSIHDLLASLAEDLKKLADDIHKLLGD